MLELLDTMPHSDAKDSVTAKVKQAMDLAYEGKSNKKIMMTKAEAVLLLLALRENYMR
jgi:hypothetical protein